MDIFLNPIYNFFPERLFLMLMLFITSMNSRSHLDVQSSQQSEETNRYCLHSSGNDAGL